MRTHLLLVAGALVALLTSVPAARAGDPPPPPSAEVEKLRAEVDALRFRTETMRRELDAALARIAALEARLAATASPASPGAAPAAPSNPPTPTPPAPAPRPSDDAVIDAYLGYTDDQLRDPAHTVTLEAVLAIVGREGVSDEVRRRAAGAITRPRTLAADPTLSIDGRGEARARVRFSQKVVTLLIDVDPTVRALAHEILTSLWGAAAARDPALQRIDPLDLEVCYRASKAWEAFFRR